MPILPENDVNAFNASQVAGAADQGHAVIKEAEQPESGLVGLNKLQHASDTVSAAFEQNNLIGGAIYRHNHPEPNSPYDASFNPLDHIPKGYEDQADFFSDANSVNDIEWRRQYLDHSHELNRMIQANPKLGTVSALASGLVDPINVAAMFVPVAGETRLARMGYSALQVGATTAAQEAAFHAVDPTRTTEGSLENIGTSALLGGVIGGLIRPRLKGVDIDELANEARTNPEKVLGDPTVRVFNDAYPKPPESVQSVSNDLHDLAESMSVHEGEMTDEQLKAFQGLRSDVQAKENLDGLGKRVPKQQGRANDGGQGTEVKQPLQVYRGTEIPLAPEHFDEEALGKASGHPSSGLGVFFTNDAEDAAHYGSKVETANLDIRNPKIIKFENLPSFDSLDEAAKFRKNLQKQGYDGIILDASHLDGPTQYVAFKPEQVVHVKPAQPDFTNPKAFEVPTLDVPPEGFGHVNMSDESTVGAAASRESNLQTERVAPGAQTIVEGPLGHVTPGGRLLSSPLLSTRKLAQRLGNVNQILVKNAAGEATSIPIERKLWKAEGLWMQAKDERDAMYKTYKQRLDAAGQQPLSRSDWNETVSQAMRRGDAHPIPEVAQAAQQTRAKVIDPYWQRAQKAAADGALQLPEESKLYADSYLMRQYDAAKIKGDIKGFIDTIRNHLVLHENMDPAEATDAAHHAMRSVLGSERGTMDWKVFDDVVGKTGRLKERTLAIPDKVLEPYLNNDIDSLTHSYLRSMAPTVEMAEEFGNIDLKTQLQEIKDEAALQIERANASGDTAKAQALYKQMESDSRDIAAVRDRLYGKFGNPKDPSSFFVRAGRMLRLNNAWRLLGGATLSHIPDFANIVARYGMQNTMAATMKLASSLDAIKLTRLEAHRMGLGLDMAMNTASLLGDFGSHSQFAEQRIGQKIAKGFTIATGETPLITMTQMMASTIAQDELLRAAEKSGAGGVLNKNLVTRLASAGIDESMLQRIADQHAQFGKEVNGLKFGMSDIWKDKQAAMAFETAILKDAHNVTLRPGVMDTPLFMSTELGKLIFQFKSFGFAAWAGILQPTAQGMVRGDPRSFAAVLALASTGALSYVLKQKAAGQPIETDNPGRFALEVADKSNLMGWTAEAIFPALWQMGFKDLSRWSDRDPIETFGGPSFGTLASTLARRLPAKIMGNPDDPANTFKRSDLHFIRRTFLPAQNLWWARRGINDAEDTVGDMFAIPGESNKDRMEARQ